MRRSSHLDDQRCVTDDELAAYRGSQMSIPEMATVLRHVEGCKACQIRMQGGARIIQFRPRDVEEVEAPPPGTSFLQRPVFVALSLLAVLFAGLIIGRLCSDLRQPQRVLNLLLAEVSDQGLLLNPASASLLNHEGVPLRLTPQAARPPRDTPTGGGDEHSASFTELDRRWLELATLEAVELRSDPRVLQGFAYLTLAHARSEQEWGRAQRALSLAKDRDATSAEVLNDLAVVSVVLDGEDGVNAAWPLLTRALELSAMFSPALYNQAVLARGRVPAQEELSLIIDYLAVEGGSTWARPLHQRHDELEARLSEVR